MGDDVDAPHEAVWDVDDGVTLQDLLEKAAPYCLQRQDTCWVAYLGYNRADGEPLAVVAAQWPKPRMLTGVAAAELAMRTGELEIFWAYRTRTDPEALWRQLGGGQEPPI
jgi:hypothetical protein